MSGSASRREQARLQKLSRFLSLLLRHRPARFPIRLDAQGFADLDQVLHMVQALPNFRWATLGDIEAAVELPGPRRFEIASPGADVRRIRALYGHSAVRPAYDPVIPPATLYYGIDAGELATARREGLRPSDRAYLSLSTEPAPARSAALRYALEPIVLAIDAAEAHAAGHSFYHPTDTVYLSDHIPPKYIVGTL